MKRKTFKLMVIGEGGIFLEVPSADYDEEIDLVRYKDVLYDIPTGLWVVKLSHIKNNTKYWKGCGAFPETTMTSMLELVKSNGIFKHRLNKQREEVHKRNLVPIMNKKQTDLFNCW
jgi:hypothetical protein